MLCRFPHPVVHLPDVPQVGKADREREEEMINEIDQVIRKKQNSIEQLKRIDANWNCGSLKALEDDIYFLERVLKWIGKNCGVSEEFIA